MTDQHTPETPVQPSPQSSAPQKSVVNLDVVRILNLGCNILHQVFFKAPEIEAKNFLKDLKAGKAVKVGALTLTPKEGTAAPQTKPLELPLRIELDYSEFVGPFGFPVFREALRAMLQRIGQTLQDKKDLNVLTSEGNDSMLIHQPGIIKVDDQFNVLVTALSFAKGNEIRLKLMFVDPSQYDELNKQKS